MKAFEIIQTLRIGFMQNDPFLQIFGDISRNSHGKWLRFPKNPDRI